MSQRYSPLITCPRHPQSLPLHERIAVNGELSVRERHRVSHLVEDSVLLQLPQVSEVLAHVEPEEELAAKGIARVK
jgi:divalent metal cation (Fe/Co/Zn/Cd) transporter